MLTWWFLSYPAAFAISTHLPRKSWENVPATVLILWNPIKLHMNSYSFPLRVLELMVNLQFQPWFPCSKPPFSVVIPANSSKIPFKNPIENRMKIPLKPPIFLKVSTCTAGNAGNARGHESLAPASEAAGRRGRCRRGDLGKTWPSYNWLVVYLQ